jgi:hypothetical protein
MAGGFVACTAHGDFIQRDIQAQSILHDFENLDGFPNHLRADAISGQ